MFIFCHDYKHLPFSNKPYKPEMNFIEIKYLLHFKGTPTDI